MSHDEQCPAQPPSQAALGTGLLEEGSCGGHTGSQGPPPGPKEELRGWVTASLCFPVPHPHPRCRSVVSQGELPSWTGPTPRAGGFASSSGHWSSSAEPRCSSPLPAQTSRQQERALPAPCAAGLYTAQRSCPGPADRKGFSKEKQDRKDLVIPRKKHQHIPPGERLRDGRQRRSPRPTSTMCGNFSSSSAAGL